MLREPVPPAPPARRLLGQGFARSGGQTGPPEADVPIRRAPRLPFRGSEAVAAGRVTKAALRGCRFRRLFPDVYVEADAQLTPTLRAQAAFLLVERSGGVVAGWSAAELLGRSCGAVDVPAEVLVPRSIRVHDGLLVRRGTVGPEERWQIGGRWDVTSPLRTAWDLARRLDLDDAVVAVDALARPFSNPGLPRFAPEDLLRLRARRPRARGVARLDEIVRLADPRAESPMETRLRLLLVRSDLPDPVVQHVIVVDGREVRFDFAYPQIQLAIEYDGMEHDDRLDRDRDVRVAQLGWHTLRFVARDVLRHPARTLAAIARAHAHRTDLYVRARSGVRAVRR